MKTLQVTTKSRAHAMQVQSLFTPVNGRTLQVEKYCTGKYKASIKDHSLQVPDDVHAVWPEARRDAHGKYFALYCLSAQS
jgi:hypothetical protein